jgi:Predicted phosphoesterase or phosphohydrolase
MNKVFFISDTHFGHKNIIKYEDRPFLSVEEMDSKMIENWNSKVDKGDRVYILGDFAFSDKEYVIRLMDKLNGQKFLVKGNHDHIVKEKEVAEKFAWVKDYYVLKHNKMKFVLFHYPIQVWDCQHHGSVHLFGHVHSNKEDHHPLLETLKNAYNVGVDVNNFTPIEITEILEKLGLCNVE